MNAELQAQTDAIIKAITHFETTMHQDAQLIGGSLGVLLVVIIILLLFSRVRIRR